MGGCCPKMRQNLPGDDGHGLKGILGEREKLMASVCFYFQVHQPSRLRHYTVFENNETTKVIGVIKPCQRPIQNPATSPSSLGVLRSRFGPAAQAARDNAITAINKIKIVFFIKVSPSDIPSIIYEKKNYSLQAKPLDYLDSG